jgi:hypothetical protein
MVIALWNVRNKTTGHWIRKEGFQSREDCEQFLRGFLDRYPPVGPLTEQYSVEEMGNETGSRFDVISPNPATVRFIRKRKPK